MSRTFSMIIRTVVLQKTMKLTNRSSVNGLKDTKPQYIQSAVKVTLPFVAPKLRSQKNQDCKESCSWRML